MSIKNLLSSLADLEASVGSARLTLSRKSTVPQEIFDRLDLYLNIIQKQRGLAANFHQQLLLGNKKEANRYASLIDGLSAMIREDARTVLAAVAPKPADVVEVLPAEKVYIC